MTTTYATWNPSDKHADITLSNGNLTATCDSAPPSHRAVRATIGHSTGKHYFEILIVSRVTGQLPGVAKAIASLSSQCGNDAHGWGYYGDGNKYNNGSGTSYGSSYTIGDYIGVALDLNAGKLWFSVNGTWQASGNPASGTNAAFTGLSGTFFPMWSGDYLGPPYNSGTTNFGASSFIYAAPSGFNSGWYSTTGGGGTGFMTPCPLNGLGS